MKGFVVPVREPLATFSAREIYQTRLIQKQPHIQAQGGCLQEDVCGLTSVIDALTTWNHLLHPYLLTKSYDMFFSGDNSTYMLRWGVGNMPECQHLLVSVFLVHQLTRTLEMII